MDGRPVLHKLASVYLSNFSVLTTSTVSGVRDHDGIWADMVWLVLRSGRLFKRGCAAMPMNNCLERRSSLLVGNHQAHGGECHVIMRNDTTVSAHPSLVSVWLCYGVGEHTTAHYSTLQHSYFISCKVFH